MPSLLPFRKNKNKDDNKNYEKKKKQQHVSFKTSAALEAIRSDGSGWHSCTSTIGTGILTGLDSQEVMSAYKSNAKTGTRSVSISDTNSEGTFFSSEGPFAYSSSSRNLNIQFANKVKASRKELDSLAIRNKLEAKGINLTKLHVSSELVGRDEEIQRLRSVFEKTLIGSRLETPAFEAKKKKKNSTTPTSGLPLHLHSAVVSISGISGSGKTVLAKQLKEPTKLKGGFFCLGKFDLKNSAQQQHQKQQSMGAAQPYRAFMAASHDLAEQILECEQKIIAQEAKKSGSSIPLSSNSSDNSNHNSKKEEQEEDRQEELKSESSSPGAVIPSPDHNDSDAKRNIDSDDNINIEERQQEKQQKEDPQNETPQVKKESNTKHIQRHPLGEKIEQAVGHQGIRLLLEIFPGLSKVLKVSDQEKPIQLNIEQKTSQLTFVVRQLFRELSRYGSHFAGGDSSSNKESSSSSSQSQFFPVVLVLDDVQWADEQSLNLAQAIWTDPETSLILIATSRSNEMTDDHPFEVKLREVEGGHKSFNETDAPSTNKNNIKQIHVERIVTENLTEDAVQIAVANSLRATEENVKSLASVVFEKTLGNAYFVNEFLQTLVNDGLLTYNLGMMKWLWEEEKIQTLSVADNVGSLLSKRIEGLSDSGRALMKIAACLGQDFEEDTLSIAMMSLVRAKLMDIGSIGEIREACEQCIISGLLEQSGSQYSFVHDQVQATAFGLIPPKDLASMQLAIGQGLLNHRLPERKKDMYRHQSGSNTTDGDDGNGNDGDAFQDDVLFLAVDLCNSGSSELNERGKMKLAAPNRRAASKAIQRSAFDAAIAYSKSGLSYLEETTKTMTEKTKLLKLKFHTMLAEASFCTGDSTSTEEYAQKVIDSDFSFDEKYVGYLTKMLSEFSNDRMDDATITALYILRELGFFKNVPRNPNTFRVLKEIFKTKLLMKKYTEEELINLPPMTDEKRIRAINIIYRITNVLFQSNPNLFLVLAMPAMRWTVKYGVSKFSPPIFALYGMVVCGILEDFEHGTMIGDVALALSEKLQATQTVAMTTHVTFGFITHWKSDIHSIRKPMEYGLQTGFQMGDVNNAIATLISIDQTSVLSGYHDLSELEVIIRESVSKIRSYGQESYAAEHAITWQFVLNLIGKVDDPLVLTGEAMDQEKAIAKAKATEHNLLPAAVASYCGQLGYLYENPKFAVSSMKVVKKEDCIGYVIIPRHFSILALAYVGTALEGKRPRHNLKKCRRLLNMLKKWVAFGNINIRHFITLIEAEIAGLTAPKTAAPLYEEAIKLGGRIGGFRHDKATAHARAARFFFVVRNDDHWGSYHLDKAIQAYCEWGAVGVAQHLAKIYMVAPPTPSSRRFTFSSEISMSRRMSEILNTSLRERSDSVRLADMAEEEQERLLAGTTP